MLTFQDCLSQCDLTEEEVLAIREHEHVPEIIALELGSYLIHGPDGVPRIKAMILDDIATAQDRGDYRHSAKLKLVLKHFVENHPEGKKVKTKTAAGGVA